MRLSQFHDWLKSLPSEFDGYPVVFCDATEVDGEFRMKRESQTWSRLRSTMVTKR